MFILGNTENLRRLDMCFLVHPRCKHIWTQLLQAALSIQSVWSEANRCRGDMKSCKTWLTWLVLAATGINKRFDASYDHISTIGYYIIMSLFHLGFFKWYSLIPNTIPDHTPNSWLLNLKREWFEFTVVGQLSPISQGISTQKQKCRSQRRRVGRTTWSMKSIEARRNVATSLPTSGSFNSLGLVEAPFGIWIRL